MSQKNLSFLRFGALASLLALGSCADNEVAWTAVKYKIQTDFPGVEQLSIEALNDWLASGDPPPLLLDVREQEEYDVSHLPGAVQVHPGDLDVSVIVTDKDTPIVAYCSVGYRSSRFAQRLREQGYTHVSNLEGSIFEWANKGYPVVRDGEEVREVHPFNTRWGRLLDQELRAYPEE